MEMERKTSTTKFMQCLHNDVVDLLTQKATLRGIGLQELIRSVVVPEWLGIPVEDKRPKETLDQMLKSRR